MQYRTAARELALLVISQISDNYNFSGKDFSFDSLLSKSLDSLMFYWKETLDSSAVELEKANEILSSNHLVGGDVQDINKIREHFTSSLIASEKVLNSLSSIIELPGILLLCDQEKIRYEAMIRIKLVISKRSHLDNHLNKVMEGWRLGRLPKIDRDILRLAVVDIVELNIPVAVSFNEFVELANRYSDEQGRKLINGILRRFHNSIPPAITK